MGTWVLIWFLMLPSGPVELKDVARKHFPSEAACRKFAQDRVELVAFFKGGDYPVGYACQEGREG